MVSHGSNKYSHAYLTVTQVFIHHRFCWHRTIETAKKHSGHKNYRIETAQRSHMNGPSICFGFFSITFWNMTKLLSFDANFFVYISSSFFPVHLKVSNSLVFRYYRFFLLNNSVMEKMIYNLLLKASNETGDNKDILCTLYICWLAITLLKWLKMTHGLFFLIKIKSKLVSHFDHISCDFVRLKTGWWHWRKSYMSYFTILSEHGLLFYKIKMTHLDSMEMYR